MSLPKYYKQDFLTALEIEYAHLKEEGHQGSWENYLKETNLYIASFLLKKEEKKKTKTFKPNFYEEGSITLSSDIESSPFLEEEDESYLAQAVPPKRKKIKREENESESDCDYKHKGDLFYIDI